MKQPDRSRHTDGTLLDKNISEQEDQTMERLLIGILGAIVLRYVTSAFNRASFDRMDRARMSVEETGGDSPEKLDSMRRAVRDRMIVCIGIFFAIGLCFFITPIGNVFLLGAFVCWEGVFCLVGLLFLFVFWGFGFAMLCSRSVRERYRTAYKNAFLVCALESTFTDVEYKPWDGIPYETIANTRMIRMGNGFNSEDHIRARYGDIPFEQSDVELWQSNGRHPILFFRGRWMIFDFRKEFKSNLMIVPKRYLTGMGKTSFGREATQMKKLSMESEAFNEEYQVYAQSEHDAFYILTPTFMERIQDLAAHNRGKPMFCFTGKQLHIAVHDNKDLFEPGSVFKPIEEGQAMQKIRSEIGRITQFIDVLSLNNDLFIQEEDH